MTYIEIFSAYLPHMVKVVEHGHRSFTLDIEGLQYIENSGFELFKIHLRPLSDLTQEIEHNGERFLPILELAKISDNYYKWEVDKNSLFHKSAFCNHYLGRISFSINATNTKFYSIITTLNGQRGFSDLKKLLTTLHNGTSLWTS